jgi:hypothetical protein
MRILIQEGTPTESNSEKPFRIEDISEDDWTRSCCEEKLFLDLATTKEDVTLSDGTKITIHHYYSQASYLQYRIPVYKPIPPFYVRRTDISSEVENQLAKLRQSIKRELYGKMVVNAVGRLFENLDPEQYHSRVRRYLKVKFVN